MRIGIDISVYQDKIDWLLVDRAGISFCMVKLTEGLTYENPLDHSQSVAAKNVGIKVGYYHFGHPEKNSARDEALHFISVIRKQEIPTADIIPALDVEQVMANGKEVHVAQGTLEKWIKDFCAVMADHGFPKVLLYSNPAYLNSNLPPDHGLGHMLLWVSEYASHLTVYPKGWPSCSIWQNSGTGHVDGIPGNVDTNICDDYSWDQIQMPAV